MTPVEIKLKDFEEYMKDAKLFLRAIKILNISSLLLLVISVSDTIYTVIGVVLLLSVIHGILDMVLPNYVAIEKSYKEAKKFYKVLLDSEPCSSKTTNIEGSYDRANLLYNFTFK